VVINLLTKEFCIYRFFYIFFIIANTNGHCRELFTVNVIIFGLFRFRVNLLEV